LHSAHRLKQLVSQGTFGNDAADVMVDLGAGMLQIAMQPFDLSALGVTLCFHFGKPSRQLPSSQPLYERVLSPQAFDLVSGFREPTAKHLITPIAVCVCAGLSA
jgi:hypothetical protein